MSLAWSPPDDEGDARVDGYLIEMQKVGTMAWIKCNTTPSLICEYTLTNMPQGEQFKFRVMACNAGGSGEPSEVPGTVTVTEMLGKNKQTFSKMTCVQLKLVQNGPNFWYQYFPESPEYDLELKYKDLYVVRYGGVLRLSVPIKGKPQPTCKWSKDGGLVSARAMIASTEDASELVIKGAERSDSGVYDLLLENKVGKKKVQIKVKVIGRPSAPEGPIVFEEIQANSVRLSWKAPIDDGGSEILGYIVERREATRNAWYTVDCRVTETQLLVKGLKEGKEYHFKVTAENAFGISASLKSEQPLVPMTPLCKYSLFCFFKPFRLVFRNNLKIPHLSNQVPLSLQLPHQRLWMSPRAQWHLHGPDQRMTEDLLSLVTLLSTRWYLLKHGPVMRPR